MVDQDMLFRSGLMLAVIFLAGLFGASVARRMTDDSDHTLEEISHELAGIIRAIHDSEPGSYSSISFGDDRDGGSSLILFPSTVNGESYVIQILPGLVTLEMENRKEIVLNDECIVPCFSPDDRSEFNGILSRRSGRISGGFRIETPNSLVLKVPFGTNEGEVFIFPSSISNDPTLEESRGLIDLFNDPCRLDPGWIRMMNISTDHIYHLETSLLLLTPVLDHTSAGSCPIPVFLPSQIDIESIDLKRIQLLVFYKVAVLLPDGHIEIQMGVTDDPGQILP